MSKELDRLKTLRTLIEECEKQINATKINMPDASFSWLFLLTFFLVLLFPFLVFPLLSKIEVVAPYLAGLQYEKIEEIITKSSVQILFYALPVALVINHGISISGWKTTVTEVMKLRLYKLAAIRQMAVLESPEWSANENLTKLLLERAFEVNLTSVSTTSAPKDKEPDTGNPSVDLLLKIYERLDKKQNPKTADRENDG